MNHKSWVSLQFPEQYLHLVTVVENHFMGSDHMRLCKHVMCFGDHNAFT